MKNRKEKKKKKIKKDIEKICNIGRKTSEKNIRIKKNKLKQIVKEYILILIGSIIMAAGISLLLVPNELSTGGFSGIALIIYYLFKIPIGTMMMVLNIPLFIMAYYKVGKELFIRSIVGTGLLALFIDIFENIEPITNNSFLACIYGGILVGIGTGIILKVKASTGGSDLLSYVIISYKPQYRSGTLIRIIDTIIIILNVIFFKTIEVGLYSAISIFLMGKMIDIIFDGINFTKVLFIISPKYQEISQEIGKVINRGSTGLYSKGMYTNEENMTLLCVGSRTEVYNIQHVAKKIDSKAFIVIMNAREVWGKGFK